MQKFFPEAVKKKRKIGSEIKAKRESLNISIRFASLATGLRYTTIKNIEGNEGYNIDSLLIYETFLNTL